LDNLSSRRTRWEGYEKIEKQSANRCGGAAEFMEKSFGMKKSRLFHQTCLKGSAFHSRFFKIHRKKIWAKKKSPGRLRLIGTCNLLRPDPSDKYNRVMVKEN